MSKLSEQLRDTLTPDEQGNIHLSHGILASIPVLLTEHEKLEREAKAGKTLAEALDNLEDNPAFLDHTGWYSQNEVDNALEAYRTACEK